MKRVIASKLVNQATELEGFAGRLPEADVEQFDKALVLHGLQGCVPFSVSGAQICFAEVNFDTDLAVASNILRNSVEEIFVICFLDKKVVLKPNDIWAAASIAEFLNPVVNLIR